MGKLLDRLYKREAILFYSKHYNFRKHQAIVKRIITLESKWGFTMKHEKMMILLFKAVIWFLVVAVLFIGWALIMSLEALQS